MYPPLSATGQSSIIFCLSSSMPDATFPSEELQPFASTAVRRGTQAGCTLGAATQKMQRMELKHTSGWERAQSNNSNCTYLLSSPSFGKRGGGEERRERQTDRQRGGRCEGGSLYRIWNQIDATVKDCCNNCQEHCSYKESNGSLYCYTVMNIHQLMEYYNVNTPASNMFLYTTSYKNINLHCVVYSELKQLNT